MSKYWNPSDETVNAMTENEKVAAAVVSFVLPALAACAVLGAAIGILKEKNKTETTL